MTKNPYQSPEPFNASHPLQSAAFTPRTIFRIVVASAGVWYSLEGVMFVFQAAFSLLFRGDGTEIWYATRGAFGVAVGLLAITGMLPFDRLLSVEARHSFSEEPGDSDQNVTGRDTPA